MIQKKHKDYLLRKYEELGKVLGALLGFKATGNDSEIVRESDKLLSGLFDASLADTDLGTWLISSDWPTESLTQLADILQEKADAEARLADAQSEETQKQAQTVAQFVMKERKTFPFHWVGREIE